MTEEGKAITRRDFMRGVASATAATALGLPIIGCREASRAASSAIPEKMGPVRDAQSRVVLVRDPAVLDSGDRVNAEVLARMLDEAVTTLLGETDPQPAWRLLFKPSDVVGIKSNVWERLPTPRELEGAISRRILGVGVPEAQIRIDDRRARRTLAGCTSLLNVRPLRAHHWAGIGGCIKNYIMFVPRPSDYHGDSCADLAAIWQLPAVEGKTRLNVLAVLTPQFYGRGPHHYDPRYVWDYRGIMVSSDPVALDAVGAHLLQVKRRQYFGEDRPITPTKHVAVADVKYNLGVSDLSRIELIKLGWMEDVLV